MAAGLRSIALAGVFTWLAASCGGRSSERLDPSNAGANAGAGGGDPDGNAGRGGRGATGGSAGRGGSSGARGGETQGGASDGGAGVGGAGGTGGAGADAGRGGMAGTSGQPPLGVCDAPSEYSENLESCGDFVHRPVALGCTPPPRDGTIDGIGGDTGEEDENECMNADDCSVVADCARDDDCGPGAYCIREVFDDDLERIYYHFCFTPCQTDTDCASDELCACDYRLQNATREEAQFGMCVPADCRTDEDCEGDALCVDVFNPRPDWDRGSNFSGFRCQSPADECYSAPLCPQPPDLNDCCAVRACLYVEDRFVCGGVDTCNLC